MIYRELNRALAIL
ncbi:hypothetical protein PCS78_01445 [Escherichia coli]|uniref:Protein YhgO n=3 Tax=Escherichia coli TaxID=562 RepID=YHGO_ECOLI|nr:MULTISPECIES: protein YhgO [Enterobacteriaceae]YP_010051201.1 protein YhgO [Escherichia coli str. K-12 substr. MG1655]P0DSG6.1 RecName: Full=Protein YhgO [Escherichia coli K-12]MBU5566787.1 hypothetical protein [Escherichia sp. S69_ASV_4]MBU5598891.1 hypothetical protein [Escherichia sp. S85_ASV_4]MBU5656911.1 hypothetical protein [Escherichia sp. S2_ASV_4]MBY0616371.1 hypothetical protein [Escherichia sp. TF21-Red]MBY0627579.1 hypothetical protein [Escherichia sp. NIC32-2]MBY0636746.1 h